MQKNKEFSITADGFKLAGQPFRLLAGAIHYFRVPREYWRDRLLKLKACGLNTVETYVAWNVHQPQPDVFLDDDMLDLPAFVRLAQELGLYVIVRPGPYICSEWDLGGLPWWLLADDKMQLRCMNEPYLKAVDRWFDWLLARLEPLQISRGGPIIMMQVENEYGSFGDDQVYLEYLARGMKDRGIDVPLFTSDGGTDFMLTGGTLPGVFKTVNFGSRAAEQFAKLREHQPDGPLVCMEFWNGWFDHWGGEHHTRDPQDAAATLADILAADGGFCAYMFHGGANFGFMNGANFTDEYKPTVNCYDYDAPLTERGETTKKYELFRETIRQYSPVPQVDLPAEQPAKTYGALEFTQSADLFDNLANLSTPVDLTMPLPMEKLGQGYGLILYRAQVRGPREELPVKFLDLHDRAHIFADGQFAGIQYRNDKEDKVSLSIPKEGLELSVLVENMGRVNYGHHLPEKKGVAAIMLGQTHLYHWQAYPLPLDDLSRLEFKDNLAPFAGRPQFLKASFDLADDPADTFVKLPGFGKGLIFINGRLLSRYWQIGPQKSAWLPAPFLKQGKNELVVLELDGRSQDTVLLDDTAELG